MMDHSAIIYLIGADGKFVSAIAYQEADAAALAKLRTLLAALCCRPEGGKCSKNSASGSPLRCTTQVGLAGKAACDVPGDRASSLCRRDGPNRSCFALGARLFLQHLGKGGLW